MSSARLTCIVPPISHTQTRESPGRCQAGDGSALRFALPLRKLSLMRENDETSQAESGQHRQAATSRGRGPGVFRGNGRVQRYSSTTRYHQGWQGPPAGVLPARSFFYPRNASLWHPKMKNKGKVGAHPLHPQHQPWGSPQSQQGFTHLLRALPEESLIKAGNLA